MSADREEFRPEAIGAGTPHSQQVDWWAVHQFVESVVAQANCGPLPMAGTLAWQELAAGDPRKLLACAAAGEHHVLRLETAQEQLADASKSVAAAEDWAKVAARVRRRADATRNGQYIPRCRKEAS